MAYFLNCSHCAFHCEYIDPDDLCGASPEAAWEKPISCPKCGSKRDLGEYWYYPSPMYNGDHHEEQNKLWETRWYPRDWRGNGKVDGGH